jgi:hypothetical protein
MTIPTIFWDKLLDNDIVSTAQWFYKAAVVSSPLWEQRLLPRPAEVNT